MPPQPQIAKPGQLSEDMVKKFFEEVGNDNEKINLKDDSLYTCTSIL